MTLPDDWREKCAAGTITKEEYRQVTEHLRAGRRAAAELSAIKKAQAGKRKRKKEPKDEPKSETAVEPQAAGGDAASTPDSPPVGAGEPEGDGG